MGDSLVVSNIEKIKFQNHDAVVLCRGRTKSNKKFYAYIKADQSSIRKMDDDFDNKKDVNFKDYGEILCYGFEPEPPENVKLLMKEKYDIKEA